MTAPNRPVRGRYADVIRQKIAAWPDIPSVDEMNDLLRVAAIYRSYALSRTYLTSVGEEIQMGPFAGMKYVSEQTEGALIPRLLGTYESELHPHIAAFAGEGLDCVIDVGCAEGYYAVGLARMMPQVTVYAHDIEEKARVACAGLAAKNGVGDRVVVGGEFQPEDFQKFAGQRALVLVDAEDAEVDILQPDRGPALAGMNIIVETHDVYRRGALGTMMARFAPTHDIVRVDQQTKSFEIPGWLEGMTHLDQLLAVWEWRQRPTPWLVMTPKAEVR